MHLSRHFLFLSFFLLPHPGHATKYIEVPLPDLVRSSNLVAEAEIIECKCIAPDNTPIPAGKRCTAPGSPNQLYFELAIKKVLFFRPHRVQDQKSKPPQHITMAFTSKAHLRVPEDNYASEKGKTAIYLLQQRSDGSFQPTHEAFFVRPLSSEKDIRKALKNLKRKV